ncbi:hypothetical protein BDV93DRAFT_551940 [Ceratobasidium sp. AG-I]|nr:hypothetical protein BDV93DRAFT_551940 [Ceratobasidium sp. AG-I]
MVSEEIGTSIYHIRHFPRALIAIRGALKGLRAIHRTKLNHRDASAGNILYYHGPNDPEPRGIIMDLEYAKEHSINSKTHDDKAGTAAFMAVEVSAGRYRHDQSRLPPSQRTNQTRKTIRTTGLAFRQNSLHDYESIWWIAIWLLFSLFEPGRLRTRAYVSNYEQVFKSSANDRWLFWGESDTFALLTGHLDSELEQDYLFTMELWAEALRRLYNQSYQAGQFEAQDPEIIQQAHQLGLQTIEKLILIVSNYSNELVFLTELPEAARSAPTPDSSILPMASLSLEPISHAKPRSTRSEKELEDVAVQA